MRNPPAARASNTRIFRSLFRLQLNVICDEAYMADVVGAAACCTISGKPAF
jgi:hypothetical protein